MIFTEKKKKGNGHDFLVHKEYVSSLKKLSTVKPAVVSHQSDNYY